MHVRTHSHRIEELLPDLSDKKRFVRRSLRFGAWFSVLSAVVSVVAIVVTLLH